ncbi:hypothetical protein JYU34_015752 [Plutella xylostella]|uniref:Uncharacterized protein n=1 Tax=Plutella xylostella TaxID=51655 RepID=A0ABQ7Q4M9_PLUXY|nr:hypothetical protein JYU34_015752 [Plutella xylostella]
MPSRQNALKDDVKALKEMDVPDLARQRIFPHTPTFKISSFWRIPVEVTLRQYWMRTPVLQGPRCSLAHM